MTTFLKQGPSIQERDEHKKGLLPRVVEGLFHFLRTSDEDMTYSVELSMVLRHLFIITKI